MKISRIRVCGIAAIVLIAACAGDTILPASDDVALVTLRPVVEPLNGFYLPPDTMTVVADIRDNGGKTIADRTVTWKAQLSNATPVGDTIVSIVSRDDHTAVLSFHRGALIVLIGTVPTSSGKSISGSLYISWSPPRGI
jgi:hypothetical protein